MSTIYDKIIRLTFLGVLFLVPLFIWRGVYDVFSLDKITLLRLLTLIILGTWLFEKFTASGFKLDNIGFKFKSFFKNNPLALPVLIFFIISTLAAIFSVSPWISLLGFYKRYEGLTTLFIYLVLFFTAINLTQKKAFQEKIIWTIIWAIFFVSLYGLAQHFNLDPFKWKAEFTLTQIFSTLGNPNFFGAYLAMTFPLGLYLFLKIKKGEKVDHSSLSRQERRKLERELRKKKGQPREKRITLLFLGVVLALVYACLLITLNRGGMLALLGALTIFVIIAGWEIIWQNKKRLIILGLIFILITLWRAPDLKRRFSNILKISRGEIILIKEAKAQEEKRGEQQEERKDEAKAIEFLGSVSERFYIWSKVKEIIKDYPWTGVGLDALALVYWPYEDPEDHWSHRSLVDRAHNDFLDVAVTRGLFGLIVYLWILATIFWLGWKIYKKQKSSEFLTNNIEKSYSEKIFTAAILAGITAYLIQNQFSFGVSAYSSLFWIFMSLLIVNYQNYYSRQPKTEQLVSPEKLEIKKFKPLIIICKLLSISGLFLVFLLIIGTLRLFVADVYYKQGQVSQVKKEVDRAIVMHKKAVYFNPREPFYQEGVSLSTYAKIEKVENQEKITWLKKTIEETEKAIKLNPANGFFYNTMGVCHSSLARTGDNRKENEEKAIWYYKKAIALTPKLGEAYNNLSLMLIEREKLDEANDYLIKVLKISRGKHGAETSYKLGQKFLDLNQAERTLNLFQEVIKWRPENVDALRNLGVAYSKVGQNEKAKETFEKILEIDPQNNYAKEALKIIK